MSRSPRRKAIKELRRERMQCRRDVEAAVYEMERSKERAIEISRRELKELRESFAPTLRRLISVRIGVPFRVHAIREVSLEAIRSDPAPAVSEVYDLIDTRNLVRLCVDMPADLVRFAFDAQSREAVSREMSYAAGDLAAELMAQIWRGGE